MKICWMRKNKQEGSADFSKRGPAFFIYTNQIKGGENMRRLRNKKGQSTLEYVIIWTAIVLAILLAAKAYMNTMVNSVLTSASGKVQQETADLVGGIGGGFGAD